MKKLLLSLFISGAFGYAYAQPTWDFEAWTGTGATIEPTGWISENAVTIIPFNNPQSVFQAPSPDNHGGTYGVKITSVTLTNNPAPGQLPDPVGMLATGVLNLSPPGMKFGFGYTARPTTMSFWHKYTPNAPDTATAFVCLTKWNTTSSPQKRDTLAIGIWKSGAAVSSYTQQNVTLTYLSATVFPDSMAVIFSSTRLFDPNYKLCMNCGKAGSNLWVDDVSFSGWNGINEPAATGDVTVFPNPANEAVTIIAGLTDASSVLVYDATGRQVVSGTFSSSVSGMNRKEARLNTMSLAAGMYSYSVIGKEGNTLKSGTFNVAR